MPPAVEVDAGLRDAGGRAHEAGREDAEPAFDANVSSSDAGADAAARESGVVDARSASDVLIDRDASPAIPCFADSPASANGVRIHVEGDRCNFPYGQGGTFRYRVTLERPVPYRVAEGTSCGFCSKLGADVKPLTRATVVAFPDGGIVSYCADCDVGCCPPNREASYELTMQSYEGSLDWPARSFNGPSDTGQKPGAFFPRGPAHVLISVQLPGQTEFAALAKLPITIE